MKCEKNHILRKLVRVSAWVTPACQGGHDPGRCDHEGKVYTKGGASSSFTPRFDARLPADADGVRHGRCPAGHPRAATGLHARRLPTLRRRDPECPGNHRLPAPAEGEPEFGLCRGVRAVGFKRFASCHFERDGLFVGIRLNSRQQPARLRNLKLQSFRDGCRAPAPWKSLQWSLSDCHAEQSKTGRPSEMKSHEDRA